MPETANKPRLAKLLIAALIAIVATVGLYLNGRQASQESPADHTSAAAVQAFFAGSATRLDGQPQALSQWRGHLLVVNYWATWCPPCRQEMPALARLSRQFAAKDVQFIGLAIDSADNVQQFAGKNPPAYPLLIAGDDATEQSRSLVNDKLALPFSAVIDRQGALRLTHLGAIDESQFAARLDALTTAP
jgi:thiol-disulfide isomerase/thioredoxin